jgi:hypothetical protein
LNFAERKEKKSWEILLLLLTEMPLLLVVLALIAQRTRTWPHLHLPLKCFAMTVKLIPTSPYSERLDS